MSAPKTRTRSELAIGALVAALSASAGAGVTFLNTNREMDVKMVEIAVGILSQEPKANIAPAREWAVDLISRYAEVKPSPEVRAALIGNSVIRLPSLLGDFRREVMEQQLPFEMPPDDLQPQR